MSLVGKREALSSALSEVTGVTGYAYRPNATKPGDGWPLLGPIERDQPSGQFMITWRVLILLPTDERLASEWIDAHLDGLWEALEPEGYIDSVEPVFLTVGDARALQITMRSE